MNYIYVLLITEIILLGIAYVFCGRDIMSPSVVMTGVFLTATFFAVMNVRTWDINFGLPSYLLLSSGLLVFIITESFFYVTSRLVKKSERFLVPKGEEKIKKGIIAVQTWKMILLLLFCITCLFLQYKEEMRIAVNAGFNGSGNFITYYRNAAIIDGSKAEQQINGILRQFLKVVTVSGYVNLFLFINNVVVYKDKRKRNGLFLVVVLLACVRAFMAASRLDILKYIIYAVVVTYILIKRKNNWHWNINMKVIKYGVMLMAITLPAFYFVSGSIGRTTQQGKTMFEYLSVYIGSSINAFDLYVKNPPAITEGWGGECFSGFQGFFERWGFIDKKEIASGILGFVESENFRTNVYTFFRRPLQDFGVIGMYLFTAFVSSIFSILYHSVIQNSRSSRGVTANVQIMIYGYLFIWIAISFLDQYSYSMLTPSLPIILLLFYIIYWGLTTRFRWN